MANVAAEEKRVSVVASVQRNHPVIGSSKRVGFNIRTVFVSSRQSDSFRGHRHGSGRRSITSHAGISQPHSWYLPVHLSNTLPEAGELAEIVTC